MKYEIKPVDGSFKGPLYEHVDLFKKMRRGIGRQTQGEAEEYNKTPLGILYKDKELFHFLFSGKKFNL